MGLQLGAARCALHDAFMARKMSPQGRLRNMIAQAPPGAVYLVEGARDDSYEKTCNGYYQRDAGLTSVYHDWSTGRLIVDKNSPCYHHVTDPDAQIRRPTPVALRLGLKVNARGRGAPTVPIRVEPPRVAPPPPPLPLTGTQSPSRASPPAASEGVHEAVPPQASVEGMQEALARAEHARQQALMLDGAALRREMRSWTRAQLCDRATAVCTADGVPAAAIEAALSAPQSEGNVPLCNLIVEHHQTAGRPEVIWHEAEIAEYRQQQRGADTEEEAYQFEYRLSWLDGSTHDCWQPQEHLHQGPLHLIPSHNRPQWLLGARRAHHFETFYVIRGVSNQATLQSRTWECEKHLIRFSRASRYADSRSASGEAQGTSLA